MTTLTFYAHVTHAKRSRGLMRVSRLNAANKQRCYEKKVENGGTRPKEEWYEPGTSVRYFCHIGHILTHTDGSNVCKSDGTWKFPVPNCRGKLYNYAITERMSLLNLHSLARLHNVVIFLTFHSF